MARASTGRGSAFRGDTAATGVPPVVPDPALPTAGESGAESAAETASEFAPGSASETAAGSAPGAALPSPLLAAENLRVSFPGRGGTAVEAVRGVSLSLAAGECLAVVGESGSGKSVTARALMGLAGPGAVVHADRMELEGRDLRTLRDREWRSVRGRGIGMVLQDALVSLDPLRRVGAEVAEALRNHRIVPRDQIAGRVRELLVEAGVPEPEVRARQYPHELSGGLRQRALIASAMAAGPPLLIADEPTTALDVTVQARILDLLAERKREGTAVLLISHDLSVVARLADRVAVMYRGVFVEEGSTAQVLAAPAHPYTRELLAAVPRPQAKGTRLSRSGSVGSAGSQGMSDAPVAVAGSTAAGTGPGCAYRHRCPLAEGACAEAEPPAAAAPSGAVARCLRLDAPWPTRTFETRAPDAGPAPMSLTKQAATRGDAPDDVQKDIPEDVQQAAGEDAAQGVHEAERDDARHPVVLEAAGLRKTYPGPDGARRTAVAEVSFQLRAGEALGVLGESGSGKTTVAQLVLGLLEPDAGEVRLLGRPWSSRRERDRRADRRRIQLVQQDPLSAFDPRWTVARIIGEALGAPGRRAARRQRDRITALLARVGLDDRMLERHPAQLSGGQRQRVAIARALAPEPDVIVCDEPVSALDVSIQAQILDVFADLRDELGVALLFISHDLGVIHHVSDRVLVMREGNVVESGPVREVFQAPREEYTRALLAALPELPAPAEPAAVRPPVENRR